MEAAGDAHCRRYGGAKVAHLGSGRCPRPSRGSCPVISQADFDAWIARQRAERGLGPEPLIAQLIAQQTEQWRAERQAFLRNGGEAAADRHARQLWSRRQRAAQRVAAKPTPSPDRNRLDRLLPQLLAIEGTVVEDYLRSQVLDLPSPD